MTAVKIYKKLDPHTDISVEMLVLCGLAPRQARDYVNPLRHACARFEINTLRRFSAFIGQCMLESTNFAGTEENLFYSKPERIRQVFSSRVPTMAMALSLARNPKKLANTVYANRMGNGDFESGEGWKYRGRGLIQLTGKNNYTQAGAQCKRPYVDEPELVAQPQDAALSAAWYWAANGCNAHADIWNIDGTSRAINPSGFGLMQRRTACDAVKAALTGNDE